MNLRILLDLEQPVVKEEESDGKDKRGLISYLLAFTHTTMNVILMDDASLQK